MDSSVENIRFTFTEANLLPDKHEENIRYKDFVKVFGEEGNLLVLAIKDNDFFLRKIKNVERIKNRNHKIF